MGYVYRAEHVKLGREVALKLLREDYAQRRDAVRALLPGGARRSIASATATSSTSPTSSSSTTARRSSSWSCCAGRASAGGRAPASIPLAARSPCSCRSATASAAAHAVGVVHRDLKPDNVIVVPTSDGAELVKLLDFGVAKLIEPRRRGPRLQTAAGSVIGTPAYMSPEQAGGMAVDPRSDIYSLGAIMYELFCGQPMFRGRSFGEYVRKHLNVAPRPPREVAVGIDIDPRIETLILRCLSKSPNARFQTAEDLRGEILAILGTLETSPGPPQHSFGAGSQSWPGPGQPPPGRRQTGDSPLLALGSEPPGVPGPPLEDTPWGQHSSNAASYPGDLANGTPSPYVPSVSDGFSLDPSGGIQPGPPPRKGATALLFVIGIAAAAGLAFAIPWFARGPRSDVEHEAEAAGPDEATPAAAASAEVPGAPNDIPPPTPAPVVTPAPAPEATAGETAKVVTAASGEVPGAPMDVPPAAPAPAARAADKPARSLKPAEPKPPPSVEVKIASSPAGSVYEAGKKGALCETPCAINIQPREGARKVYTVRKKGYRDETVAIDLADPPHEVRVTLEKEAPPAHPVAVEGSGPRPTRPKEKEKRKAKVDGKTTFNPFEDPP